MLTWLIQGAVGPALVGLPVTWMASELAAAAGRWFRRLRHSDALSRVVAAATGASVGLSGAEFGAVRRLLEDERTWAAAGRGTVEDLAMLIAACLPDRPGDDALVAGRAIARGLLEFVVGDLDPGLFQQVLFARLDRLEADQASALDVAMFGVHADLAARFARLSECDAERADAVLQGLARVADRLPPGPAGTCEIALYLATLIGWLNADPWPRDSRFGGSVLTPAAIERKLAVVDARRADGVVLDADALAAQCARLVVLGGPGSGKTWLARRTARLCAEAALEAMSSGALADDVELPLFTTCGQLAAAHGDIRQAIVRSALDQLPDLGSARVLAALLAFFTERNAPTLLVLDSLDEARGPDDRLRQADTLPSSWRIVLTSRPAAWNHQLVIGETNLSRRVGLLQPLRYPADVQPFIARWFADQPESGDRLSAQLERRPVLQQAATVPLILAFYCIIGADRALPDHRHELYTRVIGRMLTGRWRDSSNPDTDPEACLATLRAWAWAGADRHPVSGVGTWADEIATPGNRHSAQDRDALDHVAAALGYRDPDTGLTMRRFTHRSLREHLVAQHVAYDMTVDEAAAELLNHLWYDPDWDYAAPAALVMHPEHDQLLAILITRATGVLPFTSDLSEADSTWQVRRFLAQAALESRQDDWSDDAAGIIARARADVVMSRQHDDLRPPGRDWPAVASLISQDLISSLSQATEPHEIRRLAAAAATMCATATDQARARRLLLSLLARSPGTGTVRVISDTLAQLNPTPEDQAMARSALLGHITGAIHPAMISPLAESLARLDPSASDQTLTRHILLGKLTPATRPSIAQSLASALAKLDPTPEERARSSQVLAAVIVNAVGPDAIRGLLEETRKLNGTAETARARAALLKQLARASTPPEASEIAENLAQLDPTTADLRKARDSLLGILAPAASRLDASAILEALASKPAAAARGQVGRSQRRRAARPVSASEGGRLAHAVALTDPEPQASTNARHSVLAQLGRATDDRTARSLAAALVLLEPAEQELSDARRMLLDLLTRTTDQRQQADLADAIADLDPADEDLEQGAEALTQTLGSITNPALAITTARALARMRPDAEDQANAAERLATLLPTATDPRTVIDLAHAIAGLSASTHHRSQIGAAVLTLLAAETQTGTATILAITLAKLDPGPGDEERARACVLALLTRQAQPEGALELAGALAALGPTAADQDTARGHLLRLTASEYRRPWLARQMAGAAAALAPTGPDRAQVRRVLIDRLSASTSPADARELTEALADLDPGPGDEERARACVLALLTRQAQPEGALELAGALAALGPTAADQDTARGHLLRLTGSESNPAAARHLMNAAIRLQPQASDLANRRQWVIPPNAAMLAAIRRNSLLTSWLACLRAP